MDVDVIIAIAKDNHKRHTYNTLIRESGVFFEKGDKGCKGLKGSKGSKGGKGGTKVVKVAKVTKGL